MEKKWNWCAIWAGVAAVATICAVGVAAWIGYNANRIAEESKKTNDRSFASVEEFNKVQKCVMSGNIVKMKYEMMNSEKMLYCEEILRRFCQEFYVMSDMSDSELCNIGSILFHHLEFEENEFTQRYGINDRDERIVLADFLLNYNNEKSKRLGIYNIEDTFHYYCDTINAFGAMLHELGYNDEEIEKSQGSFLQRIHPCFLSCADHFLLSLQDRETQRKWYPHYFKNLEQLHQNMLKERDGRRDYIKKVVKRLKKDPNTDNFIYWNAYLNFINKNDKRGKKDPYPAAEMKEENAPAAGKKEKPADKPAVKTGKKTETKRRK